MDRDIVFQRWTAKVSFGGSPTGCWEWKGSIDKAGYPKMRVDGKLHYAAKIGWWLYQRGEIEQRLYRTCANAKCVNPNHMQVIVPAPALGLPQLTAEERQERFNKVMQSFEKAKKRGKWY